MKITTENLDIDSIKKSVQKELGEIPLTDFVDEYDEDGKIVVEFSYLFKHDKCFKEGCDPEWHVFCVARQLEGNEFSLTICDEF